MAVASGTHGFRFWGDESLWQPPWGVSGGLWGVCAPPRGLRGGFWGAALRHRAGLVSLRVGTSDQPPWWRLCRTLTPIPACPGSPSSFPPALSPPPAPATILPHPQLQPSASPAGASRMIWERRNAGVPGQGGSPRAEHPPCRGCAPVVFPPGRRGLPRGPALPPRPRAIILADCPCRCLDGVPWVPGAGCCPLAGWQKWHPGVPCSPRMLPT